MSAKPGQKELKDESHNCVLCYRSSRYFGVGSCEHTVCLECFSRLRVLMSENSCPICRTELQHLIFTHGVRTYEKLAANLRLYIYVPTYKIYLENSRVQRVFEELLEHKCKFCYDAVYTFPSFEDLNCHVQQNHFRSACDLCTKNIKHFSKERKFYKKDKLHLHMKRGDPEDRSHKGHPLCEFCNNHFFDSDDLYKHLRKTHFYCHFCDADGKNHFYSTYNELRFHFRKEHFLCEEENCKNEHFTNVFRTEIDLKAHLASVHSRLLGKHGIKQCRKLEIEFSMPMRAGEERRQRRMNMKKEQDYRDNGGFSRDESAAMESSYNDPEEIYFEDPPPPSINTGSTQDFPSLGINNGNATESSSGRPTPEPEPLSKNNGQMDARGAPMRSWNAKVGGQNKLDEEFPALGAAQAGPSALMYAGPPPRQGPVKLTTVQPKRKVQNGTSIKLGCKSLSSPLNPTLPPEEFPSLTSAKANSPAGTQSWAKKSKQQSRLTKVAPSPLETRTVEVDASENLQFVPLSVNKKKKDFELLAFTNDSNNNIDRPTESPKAKPAKNKKKNGGGNGNAKTEKAKPQLQQPTIIDPRQLEDASPSKENPNYNNSMLSHKQNKSFQTKASQKPSKSSSILNSPEDFPSLSSATGSTATKSNSKKTTKPPPGFERGPAPPGFSSKLNAYSVAIAQEAVSLDQDFEKKLSITKKSLITYAQPQNFQKRSETLMEQIRYHLTMDDDDSSVDMFKSLLSQLKKSKLSPWEFYSICLEMFGQSSFFQMFPELVSLLPDIELQLSLLHAHRKNGQPLGGLSICSQCNQVLNSGDAVPHLKTHEEDDFPAL